MKGKLAWALLVGFASSAAAQWSSDPSTNLPLGDGAGSQTIPIIAETADGGAWVGWFDDSGGSFVVRLQRLNAAGVAQLDHGGLLVSSHPQDTALFGWDMIADSSGNAVLVFSDERDGGDLDIHAYRISTTGEFLWGPDGVTLSSNPDFEPAPRVAEASDGDFVFVWMRDPSTGDADIRMQRLTPAGTPKLTPGGLPVVASAGEDPGFVNIVAGASGDVIVSWLRSIKTFASPRHIRVQRFSATGTPVWGTFTSVFDAFSVPIGYFSQIRSDGSGGAYLFWHRSDGIWFNSFAQRLDGAGVERWAHNGVALTTLASRHHVDPWVVLDQATGELVGFWNAKDSTQNQSGVYGQRLSPTGVRLWGADGIEFLPVDANFEGSPRTVQAAGNTYVVMSDASGARLVGMQVNSVGTVVWGSPPVVLSTAAGTRFRHSAGLGPGNMLRAVWEDTRAGSNDVFAQNLNPAGTLGIPDDPGRLGSLLRMDRVSQGPVRVRVRWSASCSSGARDYAIYEGQLGTWPSHVRRTCTDPGGDLVEEIVTSPNDAYYLVVPIGNANEGSYGLATSGERPQAAPLGRCETVQDLTACP